MRVSYAHHAFFLPQGLGEPDVAEDLSCLSGLAEAYRLVRRRSPELMLWQYTSLESGLHSSYPAHGGYPPQYDPRVRPWYLRARREGVLGWSPPIVDVTTGTPTLTASMPVSRGDGAFAGATAIDVPLTAMFRHLSLPGAWSRRAAVMVVLAAREDPDGPQGLLILAQKSYEDLRQDWTTPVELQFLRSEEPGELAALAADALAGRSGVRKMRRDGGEALWAHGPGGPEEPFPVVIVPRENVVADAAAAERYVLGEMTTSLRNTGFVLGAVIVAVAAVAFVAARSVTRPILRIAAAGERLSGGDYDVRVDVRTGDELEDLGKVFNATGPKLKERERIKQALAVATEVQQHLLPPGPPRLEGFDIAGGSIYCDETGGDYYDFIELVDLGAGRLGVAVGDVTGHGIGAALLMASARGVLRSHAGRHGADLAELFRALNVHLVRDTGESRFMTLFYGVLDGPGRSLTWTSGGHDPALWLRRAGGTIEELPATGIPLGVIEEATYRAAGPIRMEAGDVILIGTDGIWEAANDDGELFGKDRLREVLAAHADRSAAEIHDAVVQAVRAFRSAQPQADDITLVVVKAL